MLLNYKMPNPELGRRFLLSLHCKEQSPLVVGEIEADMLRIQEMKDPEKRQRGRGRKQLHLSF